MSPKNRQPVTVSEKEVAVQWRFALRLTENENDAQVLLSQSYQRYIERRQPPGCPRTVRCKLLAIQYRLWSDQYRKSPLRLTPGPATTNPQASAQQQGYGSGLAYHIQQLPDAQRLVMLLVCVEELTCAETAEILGLSLASVKSRLVRARAAIGQQYLENHRVHSLTHSAS